MDPDLAVPHRGTVVLKSPSSTHAVLQQELTAKDYAALKVGPTARVSVALALFARWQHADGHADGCAARPGGRHLRTQTACIGFESTPSARPRSLLPKATPRPASCISRGFRTPFVCTWVRTVGLLLPLRAPLSEDVCQDGLDSLDVQG